MEQLRLKLMQAVNESGLPLEAIYYVTKDFFRDIDEAYRRALIESQRQNQEIKEEGKEE